MPEDIVISSQFSGVGQRKGVDGLPRKLRILTIRNVSNLRCSWEISRIGLLSCDVPYADLPFGAFPVNSLLGQDVKYTHPTAGPWGGKITSVTVGNGIVTLDCQSWASKLKGVVTWGITSNSLLGGLQQAIQNAAPQTSITWGSAVLPTVAEPDLYGAGHVVPEVSFFTNGQDLLDGLIPAVMDRLYDEHAWKASLRSMAWNIDPETRKFYLDFTYGRNLAATVALRDRMHNVDSRWTNNYEDIYNHIILTGSYNWIWQKPVYGPPIWNESSQSYTYPVYGHESVPQTSETTVIATNQESINRYGLRATVVNKGVTFPSLDAMREYAGGLAVALSRDRQYVTIEAVDEGGVWANIREGDVIGVDLSNSGATGNMVVQVRALDTARGVMVFSGEAMLA